MLSPGPDVQVVIRPTDRTAGWDAVWRWLLEPLPEHEDTAPSVVTTEDGGAPNSPAFDGEETDASTEYLRHRAGST